MIKNIIAWDLGATKCRAGIVEYNEDTHTLVCKNSHSVKLTEATSLENLIRKLEDGIGMALPDADAVCIGAAGHYDGEVLTLEGVYPYPMPFAHIARKKHWPSYAVIHDYAPIVCATFTSYMEQAKNIKRLNTCAMSNHGRRVALGIGTGLGLKDGVLLPNGDFWLGKNEIGHIGVATPPATESALVKRHEEFMRFLRSEKALNPQLPLTFEKVLSGRGLVRLYQFFYPDTDATTPEEVGAKMREGKITEMLDAFAWYLGLFIGTVQLIFMPEGGVWIAGGVALNHLDIFDRSSFQAGIKASPAYYAQREEYPLGVLCNHEHALIGNGYYAAKRLLPAEVLA